FKWLGSDGELYEPGDNVSADVTKLTAQFNLPEQFTLAPGGTYYFDLSGAGIPGTANDALPDATLHYVPFTYAGMVNAYKLTSAMQTTEEYAEKNKYDHSLFVAEYNVTRAVSWTDLNTAGLIFGKDYTSDGVDYTLRAPSVGSASTGSYDLERGTPQSNEWDKILDKGSGYIKNWEGMDSWGQDIMEDWDVSAHRGYMSARHWNCSTDTSSQLYYGFRPVLEVLGLDTLGADGLKAVTLDLGSGKLGDESSIQIIVETGSAFTAPASDGLTRPDGNTGSYFMWLGSDGKLYDPGDNVPADVTKLTAQFASSSHSVTITTDTLPDGKVGEAYSQILTATGTKPITWSIENGDLPADLSLNKDTGEISGTPTADGTAKFTVKAENSVGSDTKELSITITKDAPAEFTISVKTDGSGTASASLAKAAANTEITLSATPNEGYHFKEWEVESPTGLVITNNKFLMPDSDVEIKATFEEDAPPAPTDPAKPSISVTGAYTYNGSEHTATVSGYDPATMDIAGNTATDAGDYTVRVTSKTGKWLDGSTDAVTAAWSIGKATQEAPNGLIGVAPTTEGGSDGKITGVTDKMEYRMEGEYSYAACSGTEIENLSAGNYFVRYAEDNNHFASSDAEVTVGEGTPLADCTITFNAGGGSGSMEPVTVKAGTNYILPECGFTAPADQEFKAWEIGGTEYKVGDSYTVNGDIEIKALWRNSVITPTTYTVTVSNDGNGTGTATPSTAAAGTTIILTATPNTGYHLKEWKVISGGVTIRDDKFTMPSANVEVKAIFEKDAPPAPTEFTITVKTDGNGTASASHAKAVVGTEITLTATPKTGYHLKEWQVMSGDVTITNDKFLMPSANVEIKAIFEKDAPPAPTEFIVTFDGNGGTPSVGSMTTTNLKLPSLPSASRSGSYSFDGWYTEKSGGTKITTATVFSAKTTVYAHWTYTGGGGYNPPVTYYTLRFETGGGSDIPSVREAYNTYIDLTKYVPTWRGHTFIGWYSERSLMNKVSGVYLTKDMTVYALWRVDENPGTGANPFTDVSEKDWFYSDVMFVYENGLMLGTSKTLFSPHGTATRGMMATILWRMEGSPVPKGKNSFTDVEAEKWYADAITWTAENGIFAGYGKDKFGPDDPITREQLAAIFYRYADYKGYDLTVKGNLDKFKDADKITDYAKTAMQWAVGSGLVKGKSGNLLDPQGTATRAEIAAMLHRFIEKYELVQGKAPGGLMGWIDPKRLQIPKTGDSSVLGLWGISLCTSLAGCL
ncbi:InlB B-repeat-containing protein, partial [Flavonifractor plautii]|uniref:InlB B-repeat-containing protein n=1 Tax=Flavonifractor plautii TaxID=292800 RepID=UPI00325ADAB4